MMNRDLIEEIINQYTKHGWELRRVLLTPEFAESLDDAGALFGDAEVRRSDHAGLWFSRRSMPDRVAWELRQLSAAPFAMVEVIPDGLTDQERDELLDNAEDRMYDPGRPRDISH